MLLLLFLAFLAFGKAYATLSNITIDDSNSTYFTFVGSYHAVTPSAPCEGCVAQPDPAQVYNSTWHDGALRSGSFVFQGTAVYIFGIDVNNPANVSFAMNNPTVNSFHYYSGTTYGYHSLFFSATNLDASVQHTVTWLMQQSSIGGGESALFDYAIVTVDIADTSSSPAPPSPGTSSADTSSSSSSSSTFASPTSSSSVASPSSATGSATSTGNPSSTGGSSSTRSPTSSSSIESASTPNTSPSPSSSAGAAAVLSKKSKTGAIIGALVGVVVGLALIGIIIFVYLRRRRSSGATTRAIDPLHNFDRLHNPDGSDMAFRDTSGVAQHPVRPFEPVRFPPPPRSITHSEASHTASVSPPMSSVSMTPTHSESADLKPPMDLGPQPSDPTSQRARDLEVEERLRHLEELVAASQPPSYS